MSAELPGTPAPTSSPGPAKPVTRARRRSFHRRGDNATTLMALAMVIMACALLVLVLKLTGWMPSLGDGASQASGQRGQRQANQPEKKQPPTKPPRPTKDQKRAPCEPKYEVEMEGACWQSAPSKTCTDNGFIMNGKCYVPVLPDNGPPVADP